MTLRESVRANATRRNDCAGRRERTQIDFEPRESASRQRLSTRVSKMSIELSVVVSGESLTAGSCRPEPVVFNTGISTFSFTIN